jgi:hypothetical protein
MSRAAYACRAKSASTDDRRSGWARSGNIDQPDPGLDLRLTASFVSWCHCDACKKHTCLRPCNFAHRESHSVGVTVTGWVSCTVGWARTAALFSDRQLIFTMAELN